MSPESTPSEASAPKTPPVKRRWRSLAIIAAIVLVTIVVLAQGLDSPGHTPAGHAPGADPTGEPLPEPAAMPKTPTQLASGADNPLPAATTGPDTHRDPAPADAHASSAPAPVAAEKQDVATKAGHAPAETDRAANTEHARPASTAPPGVRFVSAVIQPMNYELNERFWRWRPNDIINVTDNVNNYQLGVLEVTRRTAVVLAERLSRTGSTAAFDPNLESAMNWFMVKPTRYWMPAPESKYKDGLKELADYRDRIRVGQAQFFTRADNLIPLLIAYEDLLGGCDENLVKDREADGSAVSLFRADDYFYYGQGVASAMLTILEAVSVDFQATLKARHGEEVLHHAIESCRRAVDIHPWLITDTNLSGILANHRANLAAPISHARFYLGVLIKTLST